MLTPEIDPDDPDPEVIHQLFSDISVEDFLRETSAESTENLDGRTNFDEFTDTLVEECIEHIEQQNFFAFAVLNTDRQQRFFRPDDDETAFHFAARLQREAKQMTATWLFTAMLAPARSYEPGDDLSDVDPNDPAQVQHALDTGKLRMGVCWFAHNKEQDQQRSGFFSTENPEEAMEGHVEAAHNPFNDVMEYDVADQG